MRAGALEHEVDRFRDRAPVSPSVEVAQDLQRRADRRERFGQIVLRPPERMDMLVAMPVLEQRFVPDREQRALERGEDGELVVGPLDGGQRGAHRLDLLALVERATADEKMTDSPRLERLHVRPGDVAGEEAVEASEQEADVSGGHRDVLPRGLAAR